MEIMWAHVLVVGIRVMFGEIVDMVSFARAPKNMKLALVHRVPYPVKVHVNGLGPFLADVVIGNASGMVLSF